ncbi:MAG: hypothetical protein FWE53_03725 [Firmicutes bacterium]|nr:hypothetical protein [Bacillota bacterium]
MANWEFRKFLNVLGFIAVVLIALAWIIGLAVGGIGFAKPGAFQGWLVFVGNIFAYFITAVAGYYFARSKRSIWYLITYIVAVVVIAVIVILSVFL